MGVQQKFPYEAIACAEEAGERHFKETAEKERLAAFGHAEGVRQAGIEIVKMPGFRYQPGMLRRTSHTSSRIYEEMAPEHKVEEWVDLTDPATIGALEDWLRRLRGDAPRYQDKTHILLMWARSLLGGP